MPDIVFTPDATKSTFVNYIKVIALNFAVFKTKNILGRNVINHQSYEIKPLMDIDNIRESLNLIQQ